MNNTMRIIQDKKVVYIHLKANAAKLARMVGIIELEVVHNKEKIGSVYKSNGSILRGLNKIEEKMYLPRILGISEIDVNFEKKAEEFWLDLSVNIPANDKNGKGGGKRLEVGFEYENEKDAEEGRAEAKKEALRYKRWEESIIGRINLKTRRFVEDFSIRQTVGIPMNINDYIFYRYCLAFSHVALDIKYINKSAKIRFYIVDAKVTVKADHRAAMAKKDATLKYALLLGDRDRVKFVISIMYKEIDKLRQTDNKDYPTKTNEEQDLVLFALVNKYPVQFSLVVDDEKLAKKALIEQCINYDVLRRIPHTDTIYFGDNVKIGSSIDEAVMFIEDEKNLEIRQQISSRLQAFKK